MKVQINIKWVICNLEEIIATTAIGVMLFVAAANVLARYIFNNAFSWADEVCILMLAWTTFVGSAAAYKRNLHYGMDFLVDHLPAAGKKILRLLLNMLLMIACAYLTYLSVQLTMGAVKVMPFLHLSYKYIDAAAVVGFGSMTIYSFIFFVQGLTSPEKYAERYSVKDFDETE